MELVKELFLVMIGDLFLQSFQGEAIILAFVVVQSSKSTDNNDFFFRERRDELENDILNFGQIEELKKKIHQGILSEKLCVTFLRRAMHREADMNLELISVGDRRNREICD